MYTLRPYQQEAVDATINHFKKNNDPALIALPTGAGKSLVIANLAKKAKGRVLVLAHVKELVSQNHQKYESYDLSAGIYSAGLKKKDNTQKVIFGSIQSVQNANDDFFLGYTLLIIDECHRVNTEYNSQYAQVIHKIQQVNPKLCILGLTATPYRSDSGWQYETHHKGILRTTESRFFKRCIYELPLSYMIKNDYLTPFIQIDAPVACYDFEALKPNKKGSDFTIKDIEKEISKQKRVTPGIIDHIQKLGDDRKGVMIFTASIPHAKEIMTLLPQDDAKLVISKMERDERDNAIREFKEKKYKYLVNVSVLTTGFDAPHVDLIAILRPTQSISLYQQIVGRGLRLSPGKEDCLILDYAGNNYNIYSPIIEDTRPSEDSEPIKVECPKCNYENDFWGIIDETGFIVEHFGRKCRALIKDSSDHEIPCDYRFRFKNCPECFSENDTTARSCSKCSAILVDNDKKLKEAMQLKDAHIMRPDTMTFDISLDKKNNPRLEVRYYDLDANHLSEYFKMDDKDDWNQFYYKFSKIHNKTPEKKLYLQGLDEVLKLQHRFKMPNFVIARKEKYYWQIREKIFDY